MHGVPEVRYTDRGSGNTASLIKVFCDQLGIRLLHHKAGGARSTGSVENCQNIVETHFESRLRFLEVSDVATLQALADRWRRYFCATAILSRTNKAEKAKTRNNLWLGIPADKLRTVEPDVLRSIAAWGEVRCPVRGDFTISVDTRTHYGVQYYDLRELGYYGLKPDESVYVRLNPYKAPTAIILLEKPDGEKAAFEVTPMQFDTAGFDVNAPVLGKDFKAMPKTHSERVFEEIKKDAYGVQSVEEADKL